MKQVLALIIKITRQLKIKPIAAVVDYGPKQFKYIAKSLTPDEWFALSIMLGFNSSYRKRHADEYGLDLEPLIKKLIRKQALTKQGKLAYYTRTVWETEFPKVLPSQTHQVLPALDLHNKYKRDIFR